MKKILLLIVSGLLIACTSGLVMAEPAQVTLTVSGVDLASPLFISPGAEKEVHVICSDILYVWVPSPQERTIKVSSTAGNAVFDIKPPSGTYSGTFESTKTAKYTATSPNSFYEYDIKIKTTGLDKVTVTDTGTSIYLTTNTDSGEREFATNIPEFPTVALPVAGILGLLFIFGRKKEGL